MHLRELQSAFQSHVLRGDDDIESCVAGDTVVSAGARLGIYRHAYVARLIESLGQTYPAIVHIIGDEQFQGHARDFVHSHPSRVTSIRYYGREFADYLREYVEGDSGAMLADLAHWEWALGSAFDGPDSEPLQPTALASLVPADWPRISLRMLGSMQRVATSTNSVAWWRFAMQQGDRPAESCTTPTTEWAIWRAGLTTSFRSMPEDEAWMFDAALRGRRFGDLCAGLVEFAGEDGAALRAASLLKTWSAEGWIAAFEIRP